MQLTSSSKCDEESSRSVVPHNVGLSFVLLAKGMTAVGQNTQPRLKTSTLRDGRCSLWWWLVFWLWLLWLWLLCVFCVLDRSDMTSGACQPTLPGPPTAAFSEPEWARAPWPDVRVLRPKLLWPTTSCLPRPMSDILGTKPSFSKVFTTSSSSEPPTPSPSCRRSRMFCGLRSL